MDLQLKDRVVLVTGGASGIGAAIAKLAGDDAASVTGQVWTMDGGLA